MPSVNILFYMMVHIDIMSSFSSIGQEEVNMVGITMLGDRHKVALHIQDASNAPIQEAFYSFCYLKDNVEAYVIKTQRFLRSSIHTVEWLPNGFRTSTDRIKLLTSGVYFFIAQYNLKYSEGNLECLALINDYVEYGVQHILQEDDTRTVLLAGLVITKSSRQALSFQIKTFGKLTIESTSKLSIVLLGKEDQKPFIKLKVDRDSSIHVSSKNIWFDVSHFANDVSKDFHHSNKQTVVTVAGVYFISLHLILLNKWDT